MYHSDSRDRVDGGDVSVIVVVKIAVERMVSPRYLRQCITVIVGIGLMVMVWQRYK